MNPRESYLPRRAPAVSFLQSPYGHHVRACVGEKLGLKQGRGFCIKRHISYQLQGHIAIKTHPSVYEEHTPAWNVTGVQMIKITAAQRFKIPN